MSPLDFLVIIREDSVIAQTKPFSQSAQQAMLQSLREKRAVYSVALPDQSSILFVIAPSVDGTHTLAGGIFLSSSNLFEMVTHHLTHSQRQPKMAITAQNSVLFHSIPEKIGISISDDPMLSSSIGSSELSSVAHRSLDVVDADGNRNLVASCYSPISGWEVVVYTPYDAILHPLGHIIPIVMLVLGTSFLIIGLIIHIFHSIHVKGPLTHLKTVLETASQGDLKVVVKGCKVNREIHELYKDVNFMISEVDVLQSALVSQAQRDPLTGLFNRRSFEEVLKRETARSKKINQPLSMLVLDIDHFKSYNDNFGHPEGYNLLQSLAALFQNSVRAVDVVARLGGEEFAILLPGSNIQLATTVAEKIRASVENSSDFRRPCTISIGVATTRGNGFTEEQLYQSADRALYQAKVTRNSVATTFIETD